MTWQILRAEHVLASGERLRIVRERIEPGGVRFCRVLCQSSYPTHQEPQGRSHASQHTWVDDSRQLAGSPARYCGPRTEMFISFSRKIGHRFGAASLRV